MLPAVLSVLRQNWQTTLFLGLFLIVGIGAVLALLATMIQRLRGGPLDVVAHWLGKALSLILILFAVGLFTLFSGAWCYVFYVLWTQGLARPFGYAGQDRLALIPVALFFAAPPAVLLGGLGNEFAKRLRRRRVARMFAQAAVGTNLNVVTVDYPLLEFSATPRKGLEYLPEPLRTAALFGDFTGRVEGVLSGFVSGTEAVIVDYWFQTSVYGGRSSSTKTHRLTVVAARAASAAANTSGSGDHNRADRLRQAFAQGWSDLGNIDVWSRDSDTRFRRTRLTAAGFNNGPTTFPQMGDWLAFGSEAAISDVDELRGVISALAAVLTPPRA